MMTYEQACSIEPRIRKIEKKIIADRRSTFLIDDDAVWAYGYKPAIMQCVGWEAEHEALRTSEVYETVYGHLRAVFEGRA